MSSYGFVTWEEIEAAKRALERAQRAYERTGQAIRQSQEALERTREVIEALPQTSLKNPGATTYPSSVG